MSISSMSTKDRWAKDNMDRLQKEVETTQRAGQAQVSREKIIRKRAKQKWEERLNHYLDSIPIARKTPAHVRKLGLSRDKLHQGLRKAESSLAIQLRNRESRVCSFSPCPEGPRCAFPGVSVRLATPRSEARYRVLSNPRFDPAQVV